ncbi:hypothetical protein EVA_20144, partial [gut metagenome]
DINEETNMAKKILKSLMSWC